MPNNYKIEFNCWNCGYHFYVEIQKGTPAEGNGKECPRCGMRDGFNGQAHTVDLTGN